MGFLARSAHRGISRQSCSCNWLQVPAVVNTRQSWYTSRNHNTNKAAANKLRTAAAYMKRAGVAAAQAKLAYSLVNIGKGLETMAGLNNVPKTPSV